MTLDADASVAVPVAYEDEAVLVVDKPAGLVVHPGAGHTDRHARPRAARPLPGASRRSAQTGRPGIVHRLDKDTSGLLIVARTAQAYRSLTTATEGADDRPSLLRARCGAISTLVAGVDRRADRSVGTDADADGGVGSRAARRARPTRCIEEYAEPVAASLLACTLDTGRTHQIRVHLAAIGHPVVGDDRYGGRRAATGRHRAASSSTPDATGVRPSRHG